MIYGYARVSADGQSVDAQVKQLRAARAKRIFMETASDAKSDRTELAHALRELGDGDVLMVTRLDRLAHSTRDLLNEPARVSARLATPAAAVGKSSGPWGQADVARQHAGLIASC